MRIRLFVACLLLLSYGRPNTAWLDREGMHHLLGLWWNQDVVHEYSDGIVETLERGRHTMGPDNMRLFHPLYQSSSVFDGVDRLSPGSVLSWKLCA